MVAALDTEGMKLLSNILDLNDKLAEVRERGQFPLKRKLTIQLDCLDHSRRAAKRDNAKG